MLFISAIGPHVPCGDCDVDRITGANADGITSTVTAGRAAHESTNTVDLRRLVLPRVPMRSGVPGYGYAFQPEWGIVPTADAGVEKCCAAADIAVAPTSGLSGAVSAVIKLEGLGDGD